MPECRQHFGIGEGVLRKAAPQQIVKLIFRCLIFKERLCINIAVRYIGRRKHNMHRQLFPLAPDFLVQLIEEDAAHAVAEQHVVLVSAVVHVFLPAAVEIFRNAFDIRERLLLFAQAAPRNINEALPKMLREQSAPFYEND